MRTLVVYESMYGNTHQVAEAIGRGLAGSGDVTVVPVHEATPALVAAADLLVVGGPTHAHGMTREASRQSAVEAAGKPDRALELDPAAPGEGLREWFEHVTGAGRPAAAFDTRVHMPAALSGRAAKGIGKSLRHHGFAEVIDPESFLVTKETTLEAGELNRAEEWGAFVAAAVPARVAAVGPPSGS